MNNQHPQEIYEYDGSSETNKQELKKLKGKAQSMILIYSLVVGFFLYVGIGTFFQITELETIYKNGIPESELRKIFRKPLSLDVYKAIGKWAFAGMFIALSGMVFFVKIKGNIQNLKEYNKLLNQ